MGPPDSKMIDAHQDQSTIYPEFHTKKRVKHQDDYGIHSVWKIVKFKDVFSDKIGTMKSVQDMVNLGQSVSNQSKLHPDSAVDIPVSKSPTSVPHQEEVEEDLHDEIYEDEDA